MLESVAQANAALAARATAYNNGYLRGYTGARPANLVPTGTLLGSLRFGATAFAAPSNAAMVANPVTQDSAADANGTLGYVICFASDNTTALSSHTVGVTGSGAEFIANSLAVALDQPISCSSLTLTQPVGT